MLLPASNVNRAHPIASEALEKRCFRGEQPLSVNSRCVTIQFVYNVGIKSRLCAADAPHISVEYQKSRLNQKKQFFLIGGNFVWNGKT